MYYAFTSVTTVGFGDIYPRSDLERLIIACFLLLGVNLFSMIAGELLSMLTSYNNLHEIYEDSESLAKFIGVLKHFNKDEEINQEDQKDLIDYFSYRWGNYKHHVFKDQYLNIVIQLPEEIIDILFRSIIYRTFLDRYKHVL